jgi:molybdenum cofactor cytidylyltransferase
MFMLKGQTLLQRVVTSASASSDHVIVVLGANFKEIEPTIIDIAPQILYNPDWALGMSSSIRQAMSHVEISFPDAEEVLFAVCDQPYVDSILFKRLIQTAAAVNQLLPVATRQILVYP